MSRTVIDFMNDLFASANPRREDGRRGRPDPDIPVRTVLDRAARQIDGQFTGRPLVRAGVQMTMGAAYFGLGLPAESLRHAESAYEIRRRELGPDDLGTLGAANNMGLSLRDLGRYADAERVLTEALEVGRQEKSKDDPVTRSLEINLALVFQDKGDLDRAEVLLNQSWRSVAKPMATTVRRRPGPFSGWRDSTGRSTSRTGPRTWPRTPCNGSVRRSGPSTPIRSPRSVSWRRYTGPKKNSRRWNRFSSRPWKPTGASGATGSGIRSRRSTS